MLLDHWRFLEYLDLMKVLVLRKKNTDTTPTNLGHIKLIVFHNFTDLEINLRTTFW